MMGANCPIIFVDSTGMRPAPEAFCRPNRGFVPAAILTAGSSPSTLLGTDEKRIPVPAGPDPMDQRLFIHNKRLTGLKPAFPHPGAETGAVRSGASA